MNISKLVFLLVSICLLQSKISYSQETQKPINYSIYDDVLIKKLAAENPNLIDNYLIYEKNFSKLIAENNLNSKTDTLINGKRIIPVVFHIIHNGGAENISKAQIVDAINLINIDYNKQNADTAATLPLFQSRAANCNIEFRLAKVDPNGNCTDGIIRHYDPQTNFAYFSTMKQYNWNPRNYMNIYVVNFIYPEGMSLPDGAFIGGMSPFPPSNTLSQALTGGDTLVDGVLIRQDCIGSIGTASNMGGMGLNLMNRTFTHETGHYFNLYHPFQSLYAALGIDGCGMPPIITAGDEVDDTPSEASAAQNTSVSCFVPGTRNTCTTTNDEPDMVENYMDYQFGYCTNIFTAGQYTRIDATLNSDRRYLWSKENLISTGVLDTSSIVLCKPIADFYADKKMLCAGSAVNFVDYSYSGTAQNWNWTFNGGTPATSNVQNPTITYNTPGIYEAKLTVSNSYGADSLIRLSYIKVLDPSQSTAAPFVEGLETANLTNDWFIKNDSDTSSTWEIANNAFYSGAKSLKLINFSGNPAGSEDEIITPAYNLTTLPIGITNIKFKLAYSGKKVAAGLLTTADTIYDNLKIYISTNCGATWAQKYSKTGIDLTTTLPTDVDFVPATSGEWREETFMLPTSYQQQSNLRLKFVFHSNGGNNIYIDDINITSPNVGVDEISGSNFDFQIIPNPLTETSQISFNVSQKSITKIEIFDILGKKVFEIPENLLNAGNYKYTISKKEFKSNGIYFVRLTSNNISVNKKIVVE